MTWLVTGGAGYIGAHVVRRMQREGFRTVVLDDFSSGNVRFVPPDVPVVECSILDEDTVERALLEYTIEGVVHLAAFKYAGLSVHDPLKFYRNNVEGTRSLLQAMVNAGVKRMLFSSSCSVYGSPDMERVTEKTPTRPENPYGTSKLVSEWLIRDVAMIHDLRYTNLRYFNVVGSGYLGVRDENPFGLLPAVMKCLTDGRTAVINGDDYPTRDGTCERDFVHVSDVANAHVRAIQLLAQDVTLDPVYNLGTGVGVTVLEILDLLQEISGIAFRRMVQPRRRGDPARIVASANLALSSLGWSTQHSHADAVASAWQAWLQQPSPSSGEIGDR
jgi:UDP-glucose 4-epimerase